MKPRNSLLETLRDLDYCSVSRTCGKTEVDWIYPSDREQGKRLDFQNVESLICAGFLGWTLGDDEDPRYEYLTPTARGWAIIHLYRPLSARQMPPLHSYTRWLEYANRTH
jgi:hypothetical protein